MAGQQQQQRSGGYEKRGLDVPGAEVAIRDTLFEAKGKYLEVNGGDLTPFTREYEFAMQIFRKNDYVCDVARKNPASLRDALVQSAVCGMSLDPVKAHAYLVPRGGMICFSPSYRGLRDTAIADGIIKWAESEIVHQNDHFEITRREDGGRDVQHDFSPFGERGAIIGAYSVWEYPDGRRNVVFETLEEIYDSHRSRSESWKKDQKGIWKTDEPEAIRKSLVIRAHKSWPRTPGMVGRFDAAIAASIHADGDNTVHDITETIDERRALALADRARPNLEKWCAFYKVASFDKLTPAQADDMAKRLDSAAKKQSDEAARTQRKDAKAAPAPAAPAQQPAVDKPAAASNAAAKVEQDAGDIDIDVDALWGEIDDGIAELAGGDMGKADGIAANIRKALGFTERDLTPVQVGKFRDAVKAQVAA